MTATVERLVRDAIAVLLDFDGPVTPVFANGRNAIASALIRAALQRHWPDLQLPAELDRSADPLAILMFCFEQGNRGQLSMASDVLRAFERDCAALAEPTPGSHDVIRSLHRSGRKVVIVSNNDAAAIRAYLRHHGLDSCIHDVVGRRPRRPDLMKPHPDPVLRALESAEAAPAQAVLIGDQTTDVDAARATGVRSIAYAKTPERRPALMAVGADAYIDAMRDLLPD